MPEELHQRLLRRDPDAMELLVRQYIAPVHGLARLIIGQAGGPEDVEEIAADAFARAWERIAEYEPQRSTFTNWVLMITKYAALDHRRRLIRQGFTPGGEARVITLGAAPEPQSPHSPEEEALRHERAERLRQAVDRLPEPDRELLIRRYFLEESITDIARNLGLSRTAIDNRLSRARQALKAELAGQKGVLEHV